MDDETLRRIGGNEASFRAVNEFLRAARTLAAVDRVFAFRCERFSVVDEDGTGTLVARDTRSRA